jgi:hypothetical protein
VAGHHRAGAVPGGDEWDVDGVWGAADGGANAMCRAADSDAWSANASAHSNVIADSNAVADEYADAGAADRGADARLITPGIYS